MRYDEREEIEATGEWLRRVKTVGFRDDLMFVPSQFEKLGVAPKDVVDRLDWLKEQVQPVAEKKPPTYVGRAAVPVMVLERTAQDQTVTLLGLLDETTPEEQEEPDDEGTPVKFVEAPEDDDPFSWDATPTIEPEPLVLDYDKFGPWEWAKPIEAMVDEAFAAILQPDWHDLPDFNALVLAKSRKHGRSARIAAQRVETPVRELVAA